MPPAIPRLGFGTYRLAAGEECAGAVATAVETGYRHVDTAQGYGNEASVADGVGRTDVDRDDLFVATKLSTENLAYDDAVSTARESADRLDVETIDLLYVHWPIRTYDPEGTLAALDDLVEEGLVGAVGLSNFTPALLRDAMDRLDAPVLAHQVEMHPLLQQEELRGMAVEHDHWLVAYSPLARTKVADVPEVREVAEAHDASPAQVSLAWLRSKEHVVAIPKATSPEHVRENYASLDLELDPEAVERIDAIPAERYERCVDFAAAPWNDG
jgi:diketogulonate reductase-like aldo/keto reductase